VAGTAEAGKQLRKTLEERLSKMEVDDERKKDILTKAEYFYLDDSTLWPLKESQFYLGHVPRLSDLLPQTHNEMSWLLRERTMHGTYCDWHNTSVRLASQIFGELQRRITRSWDKEKRGT
jgi:hypothetical protein